MGWAAQRSLLWVSISVIFGFVPGTFWGNSGDLDGTSPFVFFFPQLLIFSFKVTSTMEYFFFKWLQSQEWKLERGCAELCTFPWAERAVGVEAGKAASHCCPQLSPWIVWVWHITRQRDYCTDRTEVSLNYLDGPATSQGRRSERAGVWVRGGRRSQQGHSPRCPGCALEVCSMGVSLCTPARMFAYTKYSTIQENNWKKNVYL